ncbi:UDP-N-acetylmuramoyl-L-alanyl-D-glutamate--2,6-diaminopimelate ligase [Legionella sp. W05-934-2]|jgi:UDP-N-acetylmuramoyl-L-alanyl-D-glutamate--2,6-diaminopimelate ligase|uniref:UDP-N-acetylmuramoyl-L-alanyl-D-glutamate--2, 6-diaminopimelate ligase n=1 Tax=Legionella sp. W05-934-2 TaxID=1198649 RepID=UPI0034630938
MKLDNLLSPWVQENLPSIAIESIENDSRQVTKNALFLAYPGAATDGRQYIKQAIDAGAVAVAYESMDGFKPAENGKIVFLPIENLASKMLGLAQRFYPIDESELLVTGVTGTNGKTTIAYVLAQAYERLNGHAAYIGTLGEGRVNQLNRLANTTPDSLVLQKLFHRYQHQGIRHVAMETSSHALSQQRVAGVKYHQAIFTNLTQDHLDYHKTMAEYATAKAKLFAFPSLKYAIINYDDPYANLMAEKIPVGCQLITYGLHPKADIHALDMHTHQQGMSFNITSPWGKFCLQTVLIGQFNLYNILSVFASLVSAGYDAAEVVEVIRHLQPSPGRMELISHQPQIIVDFAHSPDALGNVLKTVRQLSQGKIIVVFGCGGERDYGKRPIMGEVASRFADHIIITSDNPRTEDPETIMSAIAAGVPATQSMEKISDRRLAIKKAIDMADFDDVILVAGKGHEVSQIIGTKSYPFSDQLVIKELIKDTITSHNKG